MYTKMQLNDKVLVEVMIKSDNKCKFTIFTYSR